MQEVKFKSPEELYQENTKLVPYAISKLPHWMQKQCEYCDLLQEGNYVLWKCCVGYDYTRGIKFSTYAVGALRRMLINHVQQTTLLIRPPRSKYGWDIWSVLKSKIFFDCSFAASKDPVCDEEEEEKKKETLLDLVKENMNSLAPRDKIVLEMKLLEDKSFLEISELWGITKQRVQQIYKRAVSRLREKVGV